MVSKRIVGMLLLLVLASVALSAGEVPVPAAEPGIAPPAPEVAAGEALPAEPAPDSQVLPPLSILETAQYATCTCTLQCGVCGGRLRGCYNGTPFCECFRC